MHINIERIYNKPVNSNSYIIYSVKYKSCIIIDPGTKDSQEIIEFINRQDLSPEFILLTHEHFDHIWGINSLKERFSVPLICSSICASGIIDKKKNMSVFYDQVGFVTKEADFITENLNNQLKFNGLTINFINTPGHTMASICIQVDKNLFSGDTLIKDSKTVTKLPGGNKTKLLHSIYNLNLLFKDKQIIVFPGHGDHFTFKEIRPEDVI